jgi:hypothetical protein
MAAKAAEVVAMVMVLCVDFCCVVVVVVVGCGLAHSSGIYIIHFLSKLTVPKI